MKAQPETRKTGFPPLATLITQRNDGYLIGQDAAERAGFGRDKNGTQKLYQARVTNKIPSEMRDGNYYFKVKDLDHYRQQQEIVTSTPVPQPQQPTFLSTVSGSLIASEQHPDQLLPPDVAARIDAELAAEAAERSAAFSKQDASMDECMVYGYVQSLALESAKQRGIGRISSVYLAEVDQPQIDRAWTVAIVPHGEVEACHIRVEKRDGEYQVDQKAQVALLEQQLAEARFTLAEQARELDALTLEKRRVGTRIKDVLRGWADKELTLSIWKEPLSGGEWRITSDDFPYDARATTEEKAIANYRLLLRGVLCAYTRAIEDGKELSFAQQAQLEKLQLLFDELE